MDMELLKFVSRLARCAALTLNGAFNVCGPITCLGFRRRLGIGVLGDVGRLPLVAEFL